MNKVKVFQPGLSIVREDNPLEPVKILNIVVELVKLTNKSSTKFLIAHFDGTQEFVTLKELLETGPWYVTQDTVIKE